jgi:SAM-dependent methyltransferase
VTGFSAEWLTMREPADGRARDADLSAQLVQRVRRQSPARFIDLACGTGANLRYIAPRVGGDQQWLLVDNDAALLEKARAAGPMGGVAGWRVDTRRLDLATELRALDFAPGTIVTASALLDLVSAEWLAQLVEQCRANQCTALFALSYDGRITLTPSDPDDEWIRQLVNRHQLGDKGFGPALGPAAARRTCELFGEAGYQVRSAQSDWELLPTEGLFQQALLEGWAGAATELVPNEADRCRRWLARRLAHVANQASHIVVGHEDVLAWPED